MLSPLPILAVLALAPLAAGMIDYAPKELMADPSCIFPEKFSIENFQIWRPANDTNDAASSDNTTTTTTATPSEVISFSFADANTTVTTTCLKNGTSLNLARAGFAARWGCENPAVQFIWRNERLTMIESICPGSGNYTATGAAWFQLNCVPTAANSSQGSGEACMSEVPVVIEEFTSVQPVLQ